MLGEILSSYLLTTTLNVSLLYFILLLLLFFLVLYLSSPSIASILVLPLPVNSSHNTATSKDSSCCDLLWLAPWLQKDSAEFHQKELISLETEKKTMALHKTQVAVWINKNFKKEKPGPLETHLVLLSCNVMIKMTINLLWILRIHYFSHFFSSLGLNVCFQCKSVLFKLQVQGQNLTTKAIKMQIKGQWLYD